MSNSVLIVGNALRDVYINLDPHANAFEFDEAGTPWLDLRFDENAYAYFQETPVLGGAAVALEILRKCGIGAEIAGGAVAFAGGRLEVQANLSSRFILCHHQKVAYLTPRAREFSAWEVPSADFRWLFIDRSAKLSDETVTKIREYLNLAQSVRLAVHLPAKYDAPQLELARSADLLFVESEEEFIDTSGQSPLICRVLPDRLELAGESVTLDPAKFGFLTHLTVNSAIATTVLVGAILGKNPRETLTLAKAQAENLTLDGGCGLSELENKINKEGTVNIREIAKSLVAEGKGILAADESATSIAKLFAKYDIPDDEPHRRDYRNLLLSTPDLERYLNGVILFDETTRQSADNGQNFVEFLTARGIIPGVKVDQGLENFPGSLEKFTKGLDGLAERLRSYFASGLRFTKWRAAFEIDAATGTPSDAVIERVCADLAEYARVCQSENFVPIVEPEVVHAGDYDLEACADATTRVLTALFAKLAERQVDLSALLLKCNMVLAGSEREQSAPEEVGARTAAVLRQCVPEAVAGVVFLSGGQSVEQATANLRAVETHAPFPWLVTFSFARALQAPAIEIWRGDNTRSAEAQSAFRKRLEANCEALRFSA